MRLSNQHLSPFDGICYTTDLAGVIQAVGFPNWDKFSRDNSAPDLAASSVIGRNILDFVNGDEVKQQLAKFMDEIASGKRARWIVPYRCDSPDRTRKMRLSITAIQDDGKTTDGLLFQSILLAEAGRPAIGLFDFEARQQMWANESLPILAMCSYCQMVKDADHSKDEWVAAEAYYAMGGTSEVRLSHGICPPCLERMRAEA